VITCPNYFGLNGRDAIARAGEIADLNVRSIVNEDTAACVAYGLDNDKDQNVLVYSLGGSSFNVSLLAIRNKT
jgi:molecular chaperone DnaK